MYFHWKHCSTERFTYVSNLDVGHLLSVFKADFILPIQYFIYFLLTALWGNIMDENSVAGNTDYKHFLYIRYLLHCSFVYIYSYIQYVYACIYAHSCTSRPWLQGAVMNMCIKRMHIEDFIAIIYCVFTHLEYEDSSWGKEKQTAACSQSCLFQRSEGPAVMHRAGLHKTMSRRLLSTKRGTWLKKTYLFRNGWGEPQGTPSHTLSISSR